MLKEYFSKQVKSILLALLESQAKMTAREAREKLHCQVKQTFLNDFFLSACQRNRSQRVGLVSKGHLKPHS